MTSPEEGMDSVRPQTTLKKSARQEAVLKWSHVIAYKATCFGVNSVLLSSRVHLFFPFFGLGF